MSALIEIKKSADGVLYARRLDGKPLTPEDREEAKRLAVETGAPATGDDDPILSPDDWWDDFQRLHKRAVADFGSFDYCRLRREDPELYRQIKEQEAKLDAMGEARLSEVVELMHHWRELIVRANGQQERSGSK